MAHPLYIFLNTVFFLIYYFKELENQCREVKILDLYKGWIDL
jgi:hypothetical protein